MLKTDTLNEDKRVFHYRKDSVFKSLISNLCHPYNKLPILITARLYASYGIKQSGCSTYITKKLVTGLPYKSPFCAKNLEISSNTEKMGLDLIGKKRFQTHSHIIKGGDSKDSSNGLPYFTTNIIAGKSQNFLALLYNTTTTLKRQKLL